MGCAQLEQLPDFLKKKRALAEKYRQVSEDIEGVAFFTEPEFARSNYWLNVLLLDTENINLRNEVPELTDSKGIMTRPAWRLMQRPEMFKNCPRMDLSVAENLEKRVINIPSSTSLID